MSANAFHDNNTFFLNPDNARRYDMNATRQAVESDQLIQGQITTCAAEQQSENSFTVRVGYHFVDPSNSRMKRGTATVMRADLHKTALPKPGTPVWVLYRGRDNFTIL